MKIEFEAYTNSNDALDEVFLDSNGTTMTTIEHQGCRLSLANQARASGFGLGELIKFSVDFGENAKGPALDLAVGLVSSWLYDLLRNRIRSVKDGDETVPFTPEKLKELLIRVSEQRAENVKDLGAKSSGGAH